MKMLPSQKLSQNSVFEEETQTIKRKSGESSPGEERRPAAVLTKRRAQGTASRRGKSRVAARTASSRGKSLGEKASRRGKRGGEEKIYTGSQRAPAISSSSSSGSQRRTATVVVLEACMDVVKRVVFHLSCLLLTFHDLSFTLLFIASVAGASCCGWWLPCILSLTTSLAVTVSVQVVVRAYWRISRWLQRECDDERALARCVLEMRMKGADFDLFKEPQKSSMWMKGSSVEV
ncbi:hypothetical protein ZIOFF_020632 [Zingiber officinale]|uniref:Uncharacterized protein n=1 Tax=Zingiber officinale TaxID=94328 RepID=A0A8J5H8C3_ZINOF|nr:hypothetical protein ZIOFF_020632 [Zingiber officinale]